MKEANKMNCVVSEVYREMGAEVIAQTEELQHLQTDDCRIEFMASDQKKTSKGNVVLGECFKVQELYKAFCPYDFLVVIYEPNVTELSEAQMKVLMEHELLHVGMEQKDDGTVKYFVKPHDCDDFLQIIQKYGNDWAKLG